MILRTMAPPPKSDVYAVPRAKLYEMVWQVPLSMLAPRWGISATELGKICDANEIPRPVQGWWQKRIAGTVGIDVIPALPPSAITSVEITKPVTKAQIHAQAWQDVRNRAVALRPTAKLVSRAPKNRKIGVSKSLVQEDGDLEQADEPIAPPQIPLAYSVKGLAHALSISSGTIYRLVKERELHPIRVGGRTLFVASEVVEWLDGKLAESKTRGGRE